MLESKKAFTLIEMMLVVAIIGVMTLYFSNTMHSQHKENLVAKTNAEIQHWLQALSNFYLDNQRWPSEMSELTDGERYMPLLTQCSSFSGKGSAKVGCAHKSLYQLICSGMRCQAKQDKYMGIAIEIPNVVLAKQISASLPMSIVDLNGKLPRVAAYVVQPAVISHSKVHNQIKKGWIVDSGIVRAGNSNCVYANRITLPSCPLHFTGHVIQAPLQQRTGKAQGKTGPMGKCVFQSNSEHGFINLATKQLHLNEDKPYFIAKHSLDFSKNQYQNQYYLTFCLPEGAWHAEIHDGDGLYEQQCKGTWDNYNKLSRSC